MDIPDLPPRGLLSFLDAKQRERVEREIDVTLLDLFDSVDDVYDTIRGLETSFSAILYGEEVEPFPLRMIGSRRPHHS